MHERVGVGARDNIESARTACVSEKFAPVGGVICRRAPRVRRGASVLQYWPPSVQPPPPASVDWPRIGAAMECVVDRVAREFAHR